MAPTTIIEAIVNGNEAFTNVLNNVTDKPPIDYSLVVILLVVGFFMKHCITNVANRCIPIVLVAVAIVIECIVFRNYLGEVETLMTVLRSALYSAFAAISIHSTGKSVLFNDATLNFITGKYDEAIEAAKLLEQQLAADGYYDGIELDPEELVGEEYIDPDDYDEEFAEEYNAATEADPTSAAIEEELSNLPPVVNDTLTEEVMEEMMDELTETLKVKEKEEVKLDDLAEAKLKETSNETN